MKHKTEIYSNKLIELNINNGWINPIFKPWEMENDYFFIQIEDFLEIEYNHEVKIFKVSKSLGKIILYCRINE